MGKQSLDSDKLSQVSTRSSQYSSVSIDQNIKQKAIQILKNDSYLLNEKARPQFEVIPEENEIQLGDDFEAYNMRQLNLIGQQSQDAQISKADHLAGKYDKKRYQVAMKTDQRIIDLQQKRQEALESIITPLQPKLESRREGKKINMSPEKYNYNDFISHDQKNHKDRTERRNAQEYPDYKSTSILSQINGSESLKKIATRNLEQVHKTKVSPDYVKKMLNPENITEDKLDLIKKLYEENIDFRTLYQFRDKLFESDLNKEDKLPIVEYKKILQLNLGDKVDEFNVGLLKLSDFIDLYTYHPIRHKKDKNKSEDLYFILNSNQRGTHQHIQPTLNDTSSTVSQLKSQLIQFKQPSLEKKLENIMELVGAKLMEKFNSLSAAFRFFDANLNQSISFNEFYNALDHLGIKISTEDSKKIFDYLDTDKNNAVSYNEFCELSEEKRRGIDPFRSNVVLTNEKQKPNTNESVINDISNPKALYLSNINVDDLEQMSKLQSLSSLKKRKYKLQRSVGKYPKSSSNLSSYGLNNTISYGKKSDFQEESIGNVINQNYLKDYLEDKVSRQAMIEAQLLNYKSKGVHNKSSELRSNSVAKTLKLSQIDQQIEDLKMNKGSSNDISFINIQKNHQKLKKELSLPPIKSLLNASFNGSQTSKQNISKLDRLNSNNLSSLSRNYMEEKSQTSVNLISSFSRKSPLTKRADFESIKAAKRIDPQSQEGVLDLIHKMRMQMMEIRDTKGAMGPSGSFTEKPTSMTKREKEDILGNYFSAKKQLNGSINL
eukprot:403338822